MWRRYCLLYFSNSSRVTPYSIVFMASLRCRFSKASGKRSCQLCAGYCSGMVCFHPLPRGRNRAGNHPAAWFLQKSNFRSDAVQTAENGAQSRIHRAQPGSPVCGCRPLDHQDHASGEKDMASSADGRPVGEQNLVTALALCLHKAALNSLLP